LGILLFNLLGYRLVYSYIENAADKKVELKLDQNSYDESELVSLSIPMEHLPYYSNSNQYERIDGRIEFDGIQYHFVKLRVYHDSLELLCIPERESFELQTAKDDFFKLVNDLEHAGQSKRSGSHPGSSKTFSTDYFVADALVIPPAFFLIQKKKISHYNISLLSSCLFDRDQPPKSC
jgi:hypothetical protein